MAASIHPVPPLYRLCRVSDFLWRCSSNRRGAWLDRLNRSSQNGASAKVSMSAQSLPLSTLLTSLGAVDSRSSDEARFSHLTRFAVRSASHLEPTGGPTGEADRRLHTAILTAAPDCWYFRQSVGKADHRVFFGCNTSITM